MAKDWKKYFRQLVTLFEKKYFRQLVTLFTFLIKVVLDLAHEKAVRGSNPVSTASLQTNNSFCE